MPSTRIIAPRPNHARRKALSFWDRSLAWISFVCAAKLGFSAGALRIMEALSFLPFCFFLDDDAGLVSAGVEGPKPKPEAAEFGCFVGGGGEATVDEDEMVVVGEESLGFWGSEGFELGEESWRLMISLLGFGLE